jgi:small-conductance mechanosensitive channel
MREDYVPNEKYRNMFGVERNGYGMERVDLYLAQLEVAFKKIREDNRGLKRELAEAGTAEAVMTPPPPQYAENTAEQAEMFQRLRTQLAEQQGLNAQLHAQLAEQNDLRNRLQSQTESLMGQITALRGEADELRQRLRVQPAAPAYVEDPYEEDEKQQLIGRVLVEARATAEETVRAARQEADAILRKSRQRTEELRAEQERVFTQLQGVAYALRNVLREGPDADINRGDEFAVS